MINNELCELADANSPSSFSLSVKKAFGNLASRDLEFTKYALPPIHPVSIVSPCYLNVWLNTRKKPLAGIFRDFVVHIPLLNLVGHGHLLLLSLSGSL